MSNKDKVLQLLKTNPKISFEKAKAALPGVRPNVIAIVMKGASGKKKPAKKMPNRKAKTLGKLPLTGIYSYLQAEVQKAKTFVAKAESLMELCR